MKMTAAQMTNELNLKTHDEKLRTVSKQFAGVFMGQVMKMMRGTGKSSGFIQQSNGERMFSDMADEEMVANASQSNNYGLADIIYKALAHKSGVQPQTEQMRLAAAQKEAQHAYVGK